MEQNQKKTNFVFWLICIAAVVAGLFFVLPKAKWEKDTLQSQFQDTLKAEFNKKEGVVQYSKSTLKAEDRALTGFLKEKSPMLYKLKKDRSAIVGVIQETTMKIDTTVANVAGKIKDERVAMIVDSDYKATIVSGLDSTRLSFLAKDKLKLTLDKDGMVVVTNSNKRIVTEQLNSFQVKPQKSNTWKFILGAAAGLATGYLIFK